MSSKKRYLLLYNEMQVGGIEKSIISLLNAIDYSEVEVDLLLLRQGGAFMDYIPQEVNIIDSKFQGDFSYSTRMYFKSNANARWKVRRLCYAIIQKLQKYHILASGKNISYISSLIMRVNAHYDVAIAYVDWAFDYLIRYVNADRKYAYIHVNYDDSIHEPKKDKKLFEKCNAIYAVSEDSGEVLRKRFPTCREKIKIWNNIVDEKMHFEMAEKGQGFNDAFGGMRILTAGRAAFEKGIDIAIDTCLILKDRGYDFRWYYVGQGELYESLKRKVEKLKMRKEFYFLGSKANPYRLFKECDIYVQCSRYEGYGLTLAEAAIFNKPRVVTSLDVFKEQVEHMETGILAELDSSAFADAIELLIKDKKLYEKICRNLQRKKIDNTESIRLFYEM